MWCEPPSDLRKGGTLSFLGERTETYLRAFTWGVITDVMTYAIESVLR